MVGNGKKLMIQHGSDEKHEYQRKETKAIKSNMVTAVKQETYVGLRWLKCMWNGEISWHSLGCVQLATPRPDHGGHQHFFFWGQWMDKPS